MPCFRCDHNPDKVNEQETPVVATPSVVQQTIKNAREHWILISTLVVVGLGVFIGAAILLDNSVGKVDATPSTTAATGSSSTTDPLSRNPYSANDTDNAHKLVLVASDLPGGWTEVANGSQTEYALDTDKAQNSCMGLPDPTKIESAYVQGDGFISGSDKIGSTVKFSITDDYAKQKFDGLTNPANSSCLASAVEQETEKELTSFGLTNISVRAAPSPIPGLTNDANMFAQRIAFKNSANGQTQNMYIDRITLFKGRAEDVIVVAYPNQKPPLALEQTLIQAEQTHLAQGNTE